MCINKKEQLFYLAALNFGVNWHLEFSFLKLTEKLYITKKTIVVRPLYCIVYGKLKTGISYHLSAPICWYDEFEFVVSVTDLVNTPSK